MIREALELLHARREYDAEEPVASGLNIELELLEPAEEWGWPVAPACAGPPELWPFGRLSAGRILELSSGEEE